MVNRGTIVKNKISYRLFLPAGSEDFALFLNSISVMRDSIVFLQLIISFSFRPSVSSFVYLAVYSESASIRSDVSRTSKGRIITIVNFFLTLAQ
jgi:hypothetical protein